MLRCCHAREVQYCVLLVLTPLRLVVPPRGVVSALIYGLYAYVTTHPPTRLGRRLYLTRSSFCTVVASTWRRPLTRVSPFITERRNWAAARFNQPCNQNNKWKCTLRSICMSWKQNNGGSTTTLVLPSAGDPGKRRSNQEERINQKPQVDCFFSLLQGFHIHLGKIP